MQIISKESGRYPLIKSLTVIAMIFASLAGNAGAAVISTNASAVKRVLFVCTGNFYRSRFAEALFNEEAHKTHRDCLAFSRGLRLDSSQHGISSYARQELLKRGVTSEFWAGEPKALTKADFEISDYIVVMDETEHRPMLEKQFPGCDDHKIHYWHIPENGRAEIPKACRTMSTDVKELLASLTH